MAVSLAFGTVLPRTARSSKERVSASEHRILSLPFRFVGIDTVLKCVEARLSFWKYGTLEINRPE